MKIINPKCLCRNCRHQLNCRNHKTAIRIQSISVELGEPYSTMIIRIEECKKFKKY